uniref:ABC transporter domain-containing protein n=1 Tax=Macrostomum lignano TaxID=282301 RepID=A0A1I8JFB6_9PLAT
MVSSIPVSCADSDCSKSYIEPLHSGLPAIYINDISVCYDRGCCALENQETVVQALDSISCTIYQDQITALIGHNGAGKTTLIRTLTGEQTPTSGVAVIGDRLVTDPYQRMALRRVVSTCGQTNVLCQQLTVMESITLATLSKGFMLESQIDNIKTMMEQLGLADKADVQAFDLSGGQLRKLCCIIALIGDPKIVMLDEPTSGLDPVSRRCLWRIMQERRQGRCIMLCTQFMDEADVLADRKLFLSGGRLVCAGSSLFLKHLFGCCPTIGISLRSSQDAAKLLESIPRVFTFSIELHLLAETVKILEELQRQNGSPVEAFGVSQANLDEIFMRLENFNTMDVVSAIKNRRLASIVSLKSPDDELKLVTSRVDHSLLELRLDYYKANKLQRSFSKTFGSLLVMNLRRQVRSPVQALCRLVMPLVLLAIVFSVAFVERNVIGQFWHKSRSEIIFKPMADYFSMMWRYFVSTDDDSDPWKTVRLTAVVPFSQYYTIQMEIFVLVLLFSVVPVTYMSDPVEDRSSGVRQQMRVMGLDSKIYWLNTFAIHWIQYAVFIVLSAAMCLVWNRYQSLFLLYNVWIPMLLLGSVSNLLSVYCIGALQRTPSYSVLAIYLFFILFILAVLTFVMTNRIAGAVCVWLVPPLAPMMLPFTAMKMAGYGLLFFELSHLGDIPELQKVFLNYPDTIHSLVAMAFHIVLLFGLLILLDNWPTVYSLGQQCCNKDKAADSHQLKQSQKDDDELGVQTEAQRVLKNPRSDQNLLEVRDVEKVYPNGVRAVRGVTFGAMTGEVFGLLGQNGAGKTTLMSAIVGQLAATRGKVEVRQFDGDWMVSQLGTQLGIIGFCPQHDPIFRRITVEEHLTFYSRVRGIPELLVPEQTDRLIRGLGLAEHRFKAAKELSGGNKRRLCLAIALLGCPSIVVIDEASTGVDPENKRAIWKAIRSLAEGGKRTVVVTTHSMEEVEALCGRVGIMDRGGMIGFGTVQQLRSRYGKAYTLEALLPFSADLHETSSRKSVLKAAIQQQFPQAAVLDDVGASVQFQIPTESVASLSDSIRWLADNKTELNVQYFSLHQMSLDQIFVNMIRQHAEAVLSEKDLATGKSDQGGC